MRKLIVAMVLAIACMPVFAQTSTESVESKEIVKTGLNFGPLPAIAYDADKGFQYGAILQLYNYGDGSSYPNYKSKWYFETSWFTKGSKLYQMMYDNINIFPGVRLCASLRYNKDSAYDFYGYGGYNSLYDADGSIYRANNGMDGLAVNASQAPFHPFYRIKRDLFLTRADFIGKITPALHWEAGYHFLRFKTGTIDYASINKGKSEDQQFSSDIPTLYDYYVDWGIIPESQKDGGNYSCLRFGLEYDTRDKEGAPARGIWAEAHVNLAPTWLGSCASSYRYSMTWRQYFPIVSNDILTFAYRFNYEGTIGNTCPWYILPFMTVVGQDNDAEGIGGYRTTRGIMRSRTVGLDTGLYTMELRWRFMQFQMMNQNIALGLSCFSDGSMAFRQMPMDYNPVTDRGRMTKNLYDTFVKNEKDTPHISCGAGFRFIMNNNFIVAAEYGLPISKFYSDTNPLKGQDGNGAFYINLGYLF